MCNYLEDADPDDHVISSEATKGGDRLPYIKWSKVYHALRTYLRPFGESGEGRLDFYHRSLSKTVRRA